MTNDTDRGVVIPVSSSRGVPDAARAALAVVCAAGAGLSVAGAAAPGIEWRVAAIALVCLVSASLCAEISIPGRTRTIRLPLAQPALFASSLVLGPTLAALPGVSNGIGRALVSTSRRRPLYQVLYTIFRPAVICSTAAAAYTALGGNNLRPYEVESVIPVAVCALAYVAAGALLAELAVSVESPRSDDACGAGDEPWSRQEHRFRLAFAGAVWVVCPSSGYVLSVVYALGPSYVLLVPALAAALAQATLRMRREAEVRPESDRSESAGQVDPPADRDPPAFIDHSTGLANRRYLEMFLRKELSRAERTGSEVSVATFDFEQLRRLIEAGKSEVAGEAIARIAALVKSGLRDYDLVAGHSPGRLIIVLPETGAQRALEVTERLHGALSVVKVGREQVRADVGIATYPEHGTTFEDLINSSHHALNRGRATKPGGVHSYQDLAQAS